MIPLPLLSTDAIISCPVTLTSIAITKLKELHSKCPSFTVLKISIDATGSSGVHPTLEFDQHYASSLDKTEFNEFLIDSLLIVVHNKWLPYLKNLTLDYYEGLDRQGFIFSK